MEKCTCQGCRACEPAEGECTRSAIEGKAGRCQPCDETSALEWEKSQPRKLPDESPMVPRPQIPSRTTIEPLSNR
jgi:hypothetical protein